MIMVCYPIVSEIDNLIDKKTLAYNYFGKVIKFKKNVNEFRFIESPTKFNEDAFLEHVMILWKTFNALLDITKGVVMVRL